MTKLLKSKKTGREQFLTDEQYAQVLRDNVIPMSRFTVTDIRSRAIIPTLKEPEIKEIKEIKIIKKQKHEG